MNKAGIKKFFKFCRERHSIYLKREGLLPRELWTDDKILQKFKFTNVFRELDRTTAWFSRHVRQPLRDRAEVMLATVLFRMFNRTEVGEAIFCQTVAGPVEEIPRLFESRRAKAAAVTPFEVYCATGDARQLRGYIKQSLPRGPYATGAYIISSPPGFSKLDGVLEVVKRFNKKQCEKTHCGREDWRCCAQRLLDNPGKHSLEQVWRWLREFDYLGNFHSYEIVTDLRHTRLLVDAPDKMTWCSPGPGARRGMNRILGRDKDERMPVDDLVTLICALLSNARDREWWPQPWGSDRLSCGDYPVYVNNLRPYQPQWPAWEARDVEHSLCEWDKYERVRKGEGRPRSVYR